MLAGEGGSETEAGGATSIMAGIGLDDKASGGGASGGVGAGEVFEGDRSSGGNRWPRQETIALLKIRSDMDVVFRDSSLKGPLWEEVSRKMAELGYHRSAKKCKEKFENVYKYHKRTKEGRVGKSDGKTYRFFAELEALEQHQQLQRQHQHQLSLPPVPPRQEPVAADAVPVTMVMPAGSTVSSSPHPISMVHVNPHHHHQQHIHINVPPQQVPPPAVHSCPIQMENSTPSSPEATASPSLSPSSSSTSSDGEMLGRGRKRKRKWNGFFEKLMKDVMDKQEELQKRFIEVVEKREHDRLARDEAWKMQEMARLNRERELLVQERSMAAAKDAALISFLQKLSDQQHVPFPLPDQTKTKIQTQIISQPSGASQLVPTTGTTNQSNSSQSQPQPPQPPPLPQPQSQGRVEENPVSVAQAPHPLNQLPPQQQAVVVAPMNIISTISTTSVEVRKTNGNGDNHNMNFLTGASSSRWPKAEVEALINIRSNLDQKYQENGPKGPLWEEISTAMKKLGYNRNPKRCKEKWENINKYFKKVKESNKKRPEDSKTCPYFHQLDALYREKKQIETTTTAVTTTTTTNSSSYHQVVTPLTAQPQQHWPVQHHDNNDSENTEDDDMEDDDEDEHGNGYEIVSNNAGGSMGPTTSVATTTA